jgi:hypothetical protein
MAEESRQEKKSALVLALMQSILSQVEQSGAPEEEALAAIKSAEVVIPILDLQSQMHTRVRSYQNS